MVHRGNFLFLVIFFFTFTFLASDQKIFFQEQKKLTPKPLAVYTPIVTRTALASVNDAYQPQVELFTDKASELATIHFEFTANFYHKIFLNKTPLASATGNRSPPFSC